MFGDKNFYEYHSYEELRTKNIYPDRYDTQFDISDAMAMFSLDLIFSNSVYHDPNVFAQPVVENWNTFVDPEKRFTLFYPPNLQAQGKENFLSSTDLTLTNSNASREFKITISYTANDTNLNYTGNEDILPYNDLKNLEQLIKPAFQIYNIVQNSSKSNDLYGFPTTGNILDYKKHNGESGRMLNVLGIVKGKSSFWFSYSNSVEGFYRYLPTVNCNSEISITEILSVVN